LNLFFQKLANSEKKKQEANQALLNRILEKNHKEMERTMTATATKWRAENTPIITLEEIENKFARSQRNKMRMQEEKVFSLNRHALGVNDRMKKVREQEQQHTQELIQRNVEKLVRV